MGNLKRLDGRLFQLFIAFLFAFVGVGILGSGSAFAIGSSFNVLRVNDHFEKVQQGPAPLKETSVTPTIQKEKRRKMGIGLRKHSIGQSKLSPVHGIKQRKFVQKHGTGFVRYVTKSSKSSLMGCPPHGIGSSNTKNTWPLQRLSSSGSYCVSFRPWEKKFWLV
ncbi:hypothetical protein CLV36_1143 [Laceyella sediminis]|uniref:Uncharacterized protein n=1 Tax=Laceyella sediminis TaxID=573074 RepID=A0ABX5EKH3_9BACL|nr:hypothetical protein CLV36_1143 [Laceyella sediminis]